jgi:osmotically-inducible protein OsmY
MSTKTARNLRPWCERMQHEFDELPGLRLTLPQARRLWDLDEATCCAALQTLVDDHVLAVTRDGRYRLSGCVSPGRTAMTDQPLHQHVVSALEWDPRVNAMAIGVTVEKGVVTLRGDVQSYAEKEAAGRIALHVYGVTAVANDLAVRLPGGDERTDSDIAEAAAHALAWNTSVPKDRVTISVRDGQVILEGTVDWQYQREAVTRAVRVLSGVTGITNHIAVR